MGGEHAYTKELVEQLIAGFEILAEEYRQLFSQHQDIEAKLSLAKDQVSSLLLFFLILLLNHPCDDSF